MKISLLVAAHKPYDMPNDPLYLPVEVGAALRKDHLDFAKDSKGKSISKKNPFYCELTALYWAWKNLDSDYIGLAHYRRHFASPFNTKTTSSTSHPRLNKVLTMNDAEKLLKDTDIILPNKRNYYIENLYDHYVHTMEKEPLDLTRTIIKNDYKNYLPAFDRLKTRRSAHMFNMLIIKRELLDSYCTWLFDILEKLEKDVKKKGLDKNYDAFHARFYGRISELLLDVYLETNNLSYKELKVIDIEPVNWLKKGTSFLSAKFFKKKYDKSF